MTERALSVQLQTEDLGDAIQKLAGLEYAFLERRLVADLERDLYIGRFNLSENFSSWDDGRVFGKASELRWLRQADCIHAVVIGDVPDFGAAVVEECSLDGFEVVTKHYFLWGMRDSKDPGLWWENRIPRDFQYPIPNAPENARAQVVVREYCDRDTGKACFWRCLGLAYSR